MAGADFSIGDLVWAKMKGFSPWPGRVSEPPPELRKTPKKIVASQCIFFFGSNNYAWIENSYIKPYLEFKESLIKSSKGQLIKDAIKQIELYIASPDKFDHLFDNKDNEVDPNVEFDKLRSNESEEKEEEETSATATAAAVVVSRWPQLESPLPWLVAAVPNDPPPLPPESAGNI